jgi:hypothetical protein
MSLGEPQVMAPKEEPDAAQPPGEVTDSSSNGTRGARLRASS